MASTWNKITVGSNIFFNQGDVISSVFNVLGEDQIWLERGEEDNQLLLTMDLYNASGERLGKLRRNAWPPAHDASRFEVTTNPESLTLTHSESETVVLEVQVIDQNELVVPQGRFYSRVGHRILITPDRWDINGSRMSGNIVSDCEGGVRIG